MDNIFMMDKALMAEIIKSIKSLHVKVDDFEEADKWVGIILLLEQAMDPPKSVKKQEAIDIVNPEEKEE